MNNYEIFFKKHKSAKSIIYHFFNHDRKKKLSLKEFNELIVDGTELTTKIKK